MAMPRLVQCGHMPGLSQWRCTRLQGCLAHRLQVRCAATCCLAVSGMYVCFCCRVCTSHQSEQERVQQQHTLYACTPTMSFCRHEHDGCGHPKSLVFAAQPRRAMHRIQSSNCTSCKKARICCGTAAVSSLTAFPGVWRQKPDVIQAAASPVAPSKRCPSRHLCLGAAHPSMYRCLWCGSTATRN